VPSSFFSALQVAWHPHVRASQLPRMASVIGPAVVSSPPPPPPTHTHPRGKQWTEHLPVGECVVHTAQRCVALVIQAAERHHGRSQERPHIMVGPVQDGVDAHKGRPAGTAGAVVLLALGVGITPAQPRAGACSRDAPGRESWALRPAAQTTRLRSHTPGAAERR
jgi:hypothetical protein